MKYITKSKYKISKPKGVGRLLFEYSDNDKNCDCEEICDCNEIFMKDFYDNLDTLIEEKWKDGKLSEMYWRVDGINMGWQNRSGHRYTDADSATQLLKDILPNADCSVGVYNYKNNFALRVSHHDSPMGEWYFVKAISEAEYEKNSQ